MRGFSLVLLAVLLSEAACAQVIIRGKATAYPKKDIALFIYDDYITYTEKELARTSIDSYGNFSLKVDIAETQYAFLRIDNELADFYVEKDGVYEVIFPPPAKKTSPVNEFIEKNYHDLEITNSTLYSLNPAIDRFNKMYDRFLEKNFTLIGHSAQDKKKLFDNIKAFRSEVEEKFNAVHGDFFELVVEYSFAQLEQTTLVKEETLYEKHLKDKRVVFGNSAYMAFFHDFYEQKVETYALTKEGSGFVKAVNSGLSLPAIEGILEKNQFFKDKQLRQLALIKACQTLYYNDEYEKERLVEMLDKIANEKTNAEISKAALNLKHQLTKLNVGKPAPDFILRRSNNEPMHLSDLKGKYIYLEFTDATCPPCNMETIIIKDFKKHYGDKIEFVTVAINDDFEIVRKYIEANGYDWTFIISGKNSPVLEDYNIKAVPTYYLIDRNFNLLRSPADRPSRNIDRLFYELK